VSFARLVSQPLSTGLLEVKGMGRRCIGLDVHREFAQVAVWENGRVRQAGKIGLTAEALRVFCDSLAAEDEVAIEATCNTHAIVRLIAPHVARVVVSNPQKTRAIAEAKVKTDKVDAAILGELLAADFLPSVWVADEGTHALRRQVARRANIVRQRTRLKNQVQAILQRNLIARCPAADLFGVKGRCWLAGQHLRADEELAVEALLHQIDFHARLDGPTIVSSSSDNKKNDDHQNPWRDADVYAAITPANKASLAEIGITRTSAYSCLCRRRHKHYLRHTVGRGWPPRACRGAPCRSGWGTATSRRR
jgi:Transposase